MIREAEKNAAADAERKEKVEVCNQAESVIQDTDSKLTEFKDQVDTKEAEAIRNKLGELRQLLANRDNETTANIREAIGTLQQQSLKLFEAVYKKMAAENTQSSSGKFLRLMILEG
ncbi:hypothetical protein WUBG_11279 [Wuchereria bancrofti]|nr:hypothetical protein WUBG_11279 [Wuchereria bancrofti]